MNYFRVQYAGDIQGEGYQELSNDRSVLIRHTDLAGETVVIGEDDKVEIAIIDKNPVFPAWGIE